MKLKCLFLIILISLLCIGSVSATEDLALNSLDEPVLGEVQSVDTDSDMPIFNDINENSILEDEDLEDNLEDDDALNLDESNLISTDESKGILSSSIDESDVLSKSDEAIVTVTPSAETYKYGSDVKLTVNLTGIDGIALDGIVIITVDNRQYVANVTGGSTNVIISGLENNTYTVFAEFLGNDLYESSINNDATFVVNKSKLVTADVSVEDIIYGQSVTINVANMTDVDGNTVSVFGGYQLVGPATPYGSFSVRKGKGSFSVSNLPVGDYSAYIVFGNNVGGSYEFEYYIVNFTVNKANATLNANTTNISFGEIATVNISVDGVKGEKLNETLLITLNGETYGTVDSVNGIARLEIPDLAVGNYTVGIWFGGLNSTNYNWAEYSCAFNVNKAIPLLTVNGSTVEYGTPTTVDIKVTDQKENPISGTVSVYVDWIVDGAWDVVELDENGEGIAIFLLRDVAPGSYDVIATFMGNDEYESVENTEAKIIITDSTDLNLELSADETVYGGDVIIKVTASDGMGAIIDIERVNVTINGVTDEYIVGEKSTVNLGKLNAGTVQVTVSVDDGFHKEAQGELDIRVLPSPNAILDLGFSDGKLIIKVSDGVNPINGTAIIFIEDVDGIVIKINETGKAEFSVASFDPGRYMMRVDFRNDNYQPLTEFIDYIVPKYTNASVTVTANPIREGEIANICLTVKEGLNALNGLVVLSIDNKDYAINITEGEGSIGIENLIAKEYPILARFLSNDKYEEAIGEASLTVIGPIDTVINIIATNLSYGDKAVINFTLEDSDGNPLDGVLRVIVAEEERNVTVEGGFHSLVIDGLNADNYLIVANYDGDVAYSSSSAFNKFNVAKVGSEIEFNDMDTKTVDINIDGRIGEYFKVILKDANGNPLANKEIQIGFNGKVYTRTTNATGGAQLQINLARADIYTFAIAFLGDENYNGSFAVAKISTTVQSPQLAVPNKSYKANAKTKTLSASFKSENGNPVPSRKVTFTVNGKTYSAISNDKGVATVNVSLSTKGSYKVTAKFAGDATFKATSKTATLKLT